MLNVSVLLDKSHLVLRHEVINVGAFLKETSSQILAILVIHGAQDVEDEELEHVGILDFSDCGHEAH